MIKLIVSISEVLANLCFMVAFTYVGAFAAASDPGVSSVASAIGIEGAYFFFGLAILTALLTLAFQGVYEKDTE